MIRCKEPLSGARIFHPYRAVRSTNGSTPPLQLPVRWPTPTHDQGAVCTAAGDNPDHYRVCAHEGPEATAPATAGSTVAVTSWAVYRLPPQHLDAVLARELAQRLASPRTPSLLLHWLTVPARMTGRAIVFCLRRRVLSILAKIVIGFLLIGVLWLGC